MSAKEEEAANEFALSLLMPNEEFRKKVREFSHDGICETKKVAEYFGVSIEAASLRGKRLGIFDIG